MNEQLKICDVYKSNSAEVLNYICKYVNNTPIIDNFKNLILDFDFIDKVAGYYVDYPYLFTKQTNKDNINKLCVASFLYYKSVIFLDNILDKEKSFAEYFPIINICQEETIRILSSLLNINDNAFWNIWQRRKLEYLQAFKTDTIYKIHSFEDFENTADNKSTYGKLAIDCLYAMHEIKDEGLYNRLLLTHRYMYCAMQVFDDIKDIRDDFKTNQSNLAIWQLQTAVAENKLEAKALTDGETMVKYLHLSGISQTLLDKALEYAQKAYKSVEKEDLPYLKTEIFKIYNTALSQKLNIKAYIEMLYAKVNLSTEIATKNTLPQAVQRGAEFIKNSQNAEGCWNEICNNAGVSDVWATAFITSFLNENANVCTALQPQINAAVNFLSENKTDKIFGYNRTWIDDNDSSTFGLLAMLPYKNIDADLLKLIKRFNTDGGVATYYNRDALVFSLSSAKNYEQDVCGWMQSHGCVSSAALYFLAKANFVGDELDNLTTFIKHKIQSNESLVYWWIDDVYSLYFITKANEILQDDEMAQLLKTRLSAKIKTMECTNLGDNVFCLSLLLLTLCANAKMFAENKTSADKIAKYLTENQYFDGSWVQGNAMRMPESDCCNPDDATDLKIASAGTNIRASEYHRLYTTTVAVIALAEYEQHT